MRKALTFTGLAAILFVGVAAAVYTGDAIYIINPPPDQIPIKMRATGRTLPWIEITGDAGATLFSLPATGVLPASYGGTGATSVSGAKTALGIQAGSVTTADDGTVTNTFSTEFSSAPIVVITAVDSASPTNFISALTTTNCIITIGEPAIVVHFIAVGVP